MKELEKNLSGTKIPKDNTVKYLVVFFLFILGMLIISTVNNYIETLRYIGLTPKERQQIDEQNKLKQLEKDRQDKENYDNLIEFLNRSIQIPLFIFYGILIFMLLFILTARFRFW